MITLQGIAKFPLDTYSGFHSRVMTTEISVQCDVLCGFNSEGQPDVISIKPSLVSVSVGEILTMEDEPYSHLYESALKSFVGLQIEQIGLEGVGITDAQVAEALGNVEADWAHAREHAAGRV